MLPAHPPKPLTHPHPHLPTHHLPLAHEMDAPCCPVVVGATKHTSTIIPPCHQQCRLTKRYVGTKNTRKYGGIWSWNSCCTWAGRPRWPPAKGGPSIALWWKYIKRQSIGHRPSLLPGGVQALRVTKTPLVREGRVLSPDDVRLLHQAISTARDKPPAWARRMCLWIYHIRRLCRGKTMDCCP